MSLSFKISFAVIYTIWIVLAIAFIFFLVVASSWDDHSSNTKDFLIATSLLLLSAVSAWVSVLRSSSSIAMKIFLRILFYAPYLAYLLLLFLSPYGPYA